jgi:hypothetical protein
MAAPDDPKYRFVTNQELKEELDKLPTRWEVRFLIISALIASQLLPTVDFAKAAVRVVMS